MQEFQKANSHRIIGSALYDGLVILGLLMIAGFIAVGLHYLATGKETIAPNSLAFQLYILVITISYFFYFWKKSGQTVGMKAWRIKLVSLQDKPLSMQQMGIRFLVAIPSFGLVFLGILWQYWDKSGLNWQDHASHTKLVYIPKKKRVK